MRLFLRYFPPEYGTADELCDEVGEPILTSQHIEMGPTLTLELTDSQGTSVIAVSVSELFKRINYNHNVDWTSKVDSYID